MSAAWVSVHPSMRLRQPVHYELPQALVVTGEVGGLRGTGARGGSWPAAGPPDRHVQVEGESGLGEARVEAPQRSPAGTAARPALDQPEGVRPGSARPGERDQQPVFQARIVLGAAPDARRAHRGRAVRPLDADVGRMHVRGRVLQERQNQPVPAAVHLDRVEAVAVPAPDLLAARSAVDDQIAPPGPAAPHAAHPTGTENVWVADVPVASTR